MLKSFHSIKICFPQSCRCREWIKPHTKSIIREEGKRKWNEFASDKGRNNLMNNNSPNPKKLPLFLSHKIFLKLSYRIFAKFTTYLSVSHRWRLKSIIVSSFPIFFPSIWFTSIHPSVVLRSAQLPSAIEENYFVISIKI